MRRDLLLPAALHLISQGHMKLGLAAQTKIMAVAKEKADGGGSLASSPLPLVYELASLNADKVKVGLSNAYPAYCVSQ